VASRIAAAKSSIWRAFASKPASRYCCAKVFWGYIMVNAIFWLADELISLYIFAVIAAVVISILIAFGVINSRNQIVYQVADFLGRLTDPALNVIRRWLPNFGSIDISPVILILLLDALRLVLSDIHLHLALAGLDF
jgi:YggT family protein